MKTKGLVFLFIAMLAGLAAVVLGTRWLESMATPSDNRIAVAAVELQLGGRITPDAVRMVDWPSGSVPTGAFKDAALLDGRIAVTSILPGEPILESRLAPVGTKGGLSAVVPEGKRAITVRVNDVIGVAGFALPGNYVDIMVNTESPGTSSGASEDKMISKIVLERILVLAVAQEANRDETKPKVVNAVTLEVTPEQAERLDLARSVGTLSLVLRNQVDSDSAETAGITKAELLRTSVLVPPTPAPPPQAKAPAPRRAVAKPRAPAQPPTLKTCVEVIRGVNKVTECF